MILIRSIRICFHCVRGMHAMRVRPICELSAYVGLVCSMTMTAHIVIIMGAQYYDGKEHRYVDFPITDVLQVGKRKKESSE